MARQTSRSDVEDFLIYEAELLDEWRLEEWEELFTDDGHYYVPSTDAPDDASPDEWLFYIADNRQRLHERVVRLQKRTAHVEFPHSKTRHLVSNVRIRERENGMLKVRCNFATYRTKNGVTDVYPGYHDYELVDQEGGLKIREKRSVLSLDTLRPQGKVSIII